MSEINSTLIASLYLGKISRDRLNWEKTKDDSWSSYENLRKAFEQQHKEIYPEFKEFMKGEKNKWRSLFGETFKKNSLFKFVVDNVPRERYYF